ncbi:hypothetical protein J6590_042043 [Homalodisca vitripennis]|nr:hypothetical protein J6590_042043 [Homalodisca vitripennis]
MAAEFPALSSQKVRVECLWIISGMFLQITPDNVSAPLSARFVINALPARSRNCYHLRTSHPANDHSSTLVLESSIRLLYRPRRSESEVDITANPVRHGPGTLCGSGGEEQAGHRGIHMLSGPIDRSPPGFMYREPLPQTLHLLSTFHNFYIALSENRSTPARLVYSRFTTHKRVMGGEMYAGARLRTKPPPPARVHLGLKLVPDTTR